MNQPRKEANVPRRLRDTGARYDRISKAEIKEALGAEEAGSSRSLSVFAVHLPMIASFVKSELSSTGGRPGRRGNIERKKIPVTNSEWSKLVDLSVQLEKEGVTAAPGQIAGILLKYSLESVQPSKSLDDAESQEIEKLADRILAAAASAGAPLSGMRTVAVELLRRMKSSREA